MLSSLLLLVTSTMTLTGPRAHAASLYDRLYCWPPEANARRPEAYPDCPGVTAFWIKPVQFPLQPSGESTIDYSLNVNSTFFDWAVRMGFFDKAGPSGFKDAREAERWCLNTRCPEHFMDANQSNCCLHYVQMLLCLGDYAYPKTPCRPWLPEVRSDVLFIEVQLSPLNERGTIYLSADTTKWVETEMSTTNVTVLVMFKLAGIVMGLEAHYLHINTAVCGNNDCEDELGESCVNCNYDCGKCSLKTTDIIIFTVSIIGFFFFVIIIVIVVIRRKQLLKLFDENWIVTPSEVFANVTDMLLTESQVIGATDAYVDPKYPTLSHLVSNYRNRRKFITEFNVTVATVRGHRVAVKRYHNDEFQLTPEIRKEVYNVRQLLHPNLCRFIGGTVMPGSVYIMFEYCPKGSLLDVLQNDTIPLNWAFRFSMLADIVCGMTYLHKHMVHGNLKSSNCVVDDRWICKVTDFGLKQYRRQTFPNEDEEEIKKRYEEKLKRDAIYRAPEADTNLQLASDVYSFAIIMMEMARRERVTETSMLRSKQSLLRTNISQPRLLTSSMSGELHSDFSTKTDLGEVFLSKYMELINKCMMEKPSERPTFTDVDESLKRIYRRKKHPVDTMMALMQMYSKNLEMLVEKRSRQLLGEKQKTEALLYSILPRAVADSLRNGRQVDAECFEDSTIFFSDIVGFTMLSARSTPMQIVELLNKLYTTFDSIIEKHDIFKVETIGDAYMVVSGVPQRTKHHAHNVAMMALEILGATNQFVIPHLPEDKLYIKIGMHSGPVCAGVVGVTMPRYCLFGDTVNTASRMETYSKAGMIHISNSSYRELQPEECYLFEPRGNIDVKGKGVMFTWWLMGLLDEDHVSHVQSSQSHSGSNADHTSCNFFTSAYGM